MPNVHIRICVEESIIACHWENMLTGLTVRPKEVGRLGIMEVITVTPDGDIFIKWSRPTRDDSRPIVEEIIMFRGKAQERVCWIADIIPFVPPKKYTHEPLTRAAS